jgi:hypothetical protein
MSSYTAFSTEENSVRPKSYLAKNSRKILFTLVVIFFITTLVFGFLWGSGSSSPFSSNKYAVHHGITPLLPNDGKYLQWTILQLNDVYEMLPLDQQRRVRQLLLQENPKTFTILAGDFLSPSALSQAKVNGKQMIATFNTLGLDFVTFGNHEFDLTQSE